MVVCRNTNIQIQNNLTFLLRSIERSHPESCFVCGDCNSHSWRQYCISWNSWQILSRANDVFLRLMELVRTYQQISKESVRRFIRYEIRVVILVIECKFPSYRKLSGGTILGQFCTKQRLEYFLSLERTPSLFHTLLRSSQAHLASRPSLRGEHSDTNCYIAPYMYMELYADYLSARC
jgi:hypothetical protein